MKRLWIFLASALLVTALLVFVGVSVLGPFPGRHETTGEELPSSLSLASAAEVEESLHEDPRGPVRELLTTEQGVLAVFDDDVALFGTDPVTEVWSLQDLGGPVSAGVTADGSQIVLAQEGPGPLSGHTRWAVLTEATGQVVSEDWAQESPDELVALLAADSRLVMGENGRVAARALEDGRELWSLEPQQSCGKPRIKVVGDTVAMASLCGGGVRLSGVSAETGEMEWEHTWSGDALPDMHLLTPRTVPGGQSDPVERIVRGDLADGYVLFGRGEVFDRARAQEYLPPQTDLDEAPAHVVLVEDFQDADARLVLQAGHVFLEEGLIGREELDEAGLLVNGRLPLSPQEWDGDPRMMIDDLNAALSAQNNSLGQ
ncbi:PQQ-binding-like beta-propeller repeat protein [Nocardiopsis dassonvillei]|uniref:outer membrane protein assembly factor BamB family protein n=1 Tax=Nocardiopsis dassonvillei TaxID=2014 RepID=UPI00200C60BD|nr:PQQ-binding-like beta-propeller repeat protein [Nocardiopsis dassonvillei]MCK9870896.1 PQQ-binding-like beta-propeller repeat protein [Nocardiopsis dassonvillei]